MERILEALQVVNHIVPLARAAGTVNATGVDCRDADEVAAIVSVGAIGNSGTDTTLNVKLQESDASGSGYVDIAGAAITEVPYTGDDAIPTINVNLGVRANRKRYVRAVAVVAGTDTATYGVELLLKKKTKPVTNTPASVLV